MFADIPGQARAKAYMAGALARGAGHAYLLVGPEGWASDASRSSSALTWWPPAVAAGLATSATGWPAASIPISS